MIIRSPEPPEALRDLCRRATTDGTATNALLRGLEPEGELVIEPGGADAPDTRAHQPEGVSR